MTIRFYHSFAILALASLTLPALRADVTARYKAEVTMNPSLSALAAGAMKGPELLAPQETAIRFKGTKGLSSLMGFASIVDSSNGEVTILDPAGMRFATTTLDQYRDEAARLMPEMPAAARASMASMKTSVSPSRLTGRTAVIQGVEAEEREIILSMEGPAIPNAPTDPSVRIVMQLWTAKAGEATRVPAIRELAGHSLSVFGTMNPSASLDKMFKQFPGFDDAFEPMMKEMQNGTSVLRMHMDLYIPALAALLKRTAAAGSAAANLDDKAPFMQMNQELVELSTEPVPDSVFQVPEGYQKVPASEVLQALFARSKAAVKQ